jgi:hypothetical protein
VERLGPAPVTLLLSVEAFCIRPRASCRSMDSVMSEPWIMICKNRVGNMRGRIPLYDRYYYSKGWQSVAQNGKLECQRFPRFMIELIAPPRDHCCSTGKKVADRTRLIPAGCLLSGYSGPSSPFSTRDKSTQSGRSDAQELYSVHLQCSLT